MATITHPTVNGYNIIQQDSIHSNDKLTIIEM